MGQLPDDIFENNDDYYEHIGNGLWLMDSHKWSFVIWNKERNSENHYLLVHVDYHWDAGYDFWEHPEEEENFFSSDENEIIAIVKEENFIRYDSFICPAIAKGIIDEVHFYCLQGDESGEEAIYENFLDKYNCKQVLHDSINTLSELKTDKPIFFDFCVDVFNRSNKYYESDIWSDNEIEEFLESCKQLVISAEVVTISMSYGYSGTKNDTKRLTKRVVEKFNEWRRNS
ncbi:UPF0489 family protein [Saccharospirillum mangrovi]|uniref:UPF0489 family protein n=1 Tax=Saccharospirillum mangrovi TaxID=2161747 RepID=UPI000D362F80|nr:UPF0489 family protein [Saccharospirillum mangrovi]